jgi:hypothetical protein
MSSPRAAEQPPSVSFDSDYLKEDHAVPHAFEIPLPAKRSEAFHNLPDGVSQLMGVYDPREFNTRFLARGGEDQEILVHGEHNPTEDVSPLQDPLITLHPPTV